MLDNILYSKAKLNEHLCDSIQLKLNLEHIQQTRLSGTTVLFIMS